ncbi:cytochrome P450 4C1-like isoform X1 [Vespula maculifrons]|uniref:Cytochrome P450 4C1-like isoform X1 n=1 Tax=Vespula maculifrons TaxID=7453 RepID=A0ABD2CVT6_VESMC
MVLRRRKNVNHKASQNVTCYLSVVTRSDQSSYIPLFTLQEEKPTFLLDFLFESLHEGRKYLEQDIRDEINTIAIGGSNTSVTAISFCTFNACYIP